MTENHDDDAFDRNWGWQERMQPYANRYYSAYWDVSDGQIRDVDGLDSELAAQLDYSGCDKLVHTESGDVHVAQRFRRPPENGYSRDFSLRKTTTNGMKSEWYKLQRAYQNGYYIPTRYAFGVAGDEGFDYFCLLDNRRFVRLLTNGELEGKETNENKVDGKEVVYYPINRLAECDVVLREWGEKDGVVK